MNKEDQQTIEIENSFKQQAVYMSDVPSNDYVQQSDYTIKEYSYDGEKQTTGQSWADGKVTATVANDNFELTASWFVWKDRDKTKGSSFGADATYSFSLDKSAGVEVKPLKGVSYISQQSPDVLREQRKSSSSKSSSSTSRGSSSSGSSSSSSSGLFGGNSSSSDSSTSSSEDLVNSIGANKSIDPTSFASTLTDDNTKCEAVATYEYSDMWFSDATETDNYRFTFKKSDSSGKYAWTKESEQNNDINLTNVYKDLNGSYLAQGSKDVKSFKITGLDANAGTFTVSGTVVNNSGYREETLQFTMSVSIKPTTSISSSTEFKDTFTDTPFGDGYYYEFAGSGPNASTIRGVIGLAKNGSKALYIKDMKVKDDDHHSWSPGSDSSWNRLLIKQ